MRKFYKFINNESGATAIEYGLIASLIGVVIIVGITSLGSATETMYDFIETSIVDATDKVGE